MKSWVFTFRVVPPTHTVSARNGADVFFAGYSRVLQRWTMVLPGGCEEHIDEPQMIFLEDEYAKAHAKDLSESVRRPAVRLRKGKEKAVQCQLAL